MENPDDKIPPPMPEAAEPLFGVISRPKKMSGAWYLRAFLDTREAATNTIAHDKKIGLVSLLVQVIPCTEADLKPKAKPKVRQASTRKRNGRPGDAVPVIQDTAPAEGV